VESVLRDAGTELEDLSGIAVSIGPGSFTGLRIGLSVAKGLVYATGLPLVAVSTLEALALRLAGGALEPPPKLILAALDARREDVYCQLFAAQEDVITPVWPVRDIALHALADALAEQGVGEGGHAVTLTGNARQAAAKALGSPGSRVQLRLVPDHLAVCAASTVARIGTQLLLRGEAENPATLEPRYIKEFFLKSRTEQTGH
jgi:tRNA threonylcarbamoyladenosine biosynthesis protein TsaB